MIYIFTTFVSVLILFTGCATMQAPLTKQTFDQIKLVDCTLFVPQNKIKISVPETYFTSPGVGSIGKLVANTMDLNAASRSVSKETSVKIVKQLEGYDFRKAMLTALSVEIKKSKTIKFNSHVNLSKDNSFSQKRILFSKAQGNMVLFIDVYYRTESGNLIISALAQMFPKSEHLLKFNKTPDGLDPLAEGKLVYRNYFSFTKKAALTYNTKYILTEGTKSIAKQIIADINKPI